VRRTCLCLAAVAVAALAGCAARPLTEAERAFTATLHDRALDAAAVRIHRGAVIGGWPMTRPPRPYRACRERIFPREREPEIETSVAGFVLGNRIFVARDLYARDYLGDYPETLPLTAAMFLAHELTHVWQWQTRETTGYAPWRAAGEHAARADPYLFDLAVGRDFLDYGYEQQAALIEEYVCCRALDPDGARTGRLRALLRPHFPGLAPRSPARRVAIPWTGAQTEGICSDG